MKTIALPNQATVNHTVDGTCYSPKLIVPNSTFCYIGKYKYTVKAWAQEAAEKWLKASIEAGHVVDEPVRKDA